MLKIKKSKNDLENALDFFIWEFKIGDNIKYNLNVLYELIDDYNTSKKNYGKPISVIAVSVIEAIMIDFIYRLYHGTSHFPACLSNEENNIKTKLQGETIKSSVEVVEGQKFEYIKLKNFNFNSMIDVFSELKLFGDKDNIYKILQELAHFRNRVHINNYFNNFEKDENVTFSEKRVQRTMDVMYWIFEYFKINYNRPW